MTDSTAIRENLKASKSIGELNRFVSESPTAIRDHAIPTQLGTENYRILVSEIIAAIVKGDIGLGNVDNTSDANKPLSNASRAALQQKADTNHTHTAASLEGLGDLLAEFFTKNDQIPLQNLQAVVEALTGKADTAHTHSPANIEGLTELLNEMANAQHTHALSDLTGYTELMNYINQNFSIRPTADQVNVLIASASTTNITEIPGQW